MLWYAIGWLVVVFLLVVVELATYALVTTWFAIGAAGAFVVAVCGGNFYIQMIVFVVLSLTTLIFTRPLVKKKLSFTKEKTNADRVIGMKGKVIEEIDGDSQTGQVNVAGQLWSAKSIDGEKISIGENVQIEQIKGVKLLVKK